MKKIFITSLFLLFIYSACTDGLEPEIFGALNPTIFPSTPVEYELYALDVYAPFSSKWGYDDGGFKYQFFALEEGHIQLFDHPTDIMATFPDWGNGGPVWDAKSKGDFSPLVGQDRQRSHFEKVRFITKCTRIIDDIEQATVFSNEEDKMKLIGEVKMARAWAMYHMLHLYGPVPVILDPALIGNEEAESDLTRPSRQEYVGSMISDLQYAADNLPKEQQQFGRFNKGAALVQLMRTYLNEKDFQNAELVGRDIMDLGYGLESDYSSIFKESNERNNEVIYAISSDPLGQGRGPDGNFNAYVYYTRPWDYPGKGGWSDVWTASWEFFDTLDPVDKRRELLDDSSISAGGEQRDRTSMRGAIISKYPPEGDNAFQGNDIVLSRYADVLLMMAEAINENNNGPNQEAIDLVLQVRHRAGLLGNLPPEDIASKEAFNDAILRERAWELYFEGMRKIDLERHGKWPEAVAAVAGKNPGSTSLFPVPQYAIDQGAGTLTQTPGY